MKEHFNDYDEMLLKIMEESELDLDEAISDLSEDEIDPLEEESLRELDEKVYGDIRSYQESRQRREAEKACAVENASKTGNPMRNQTDDAVDIDGREACEQSDMERPDRECSDVVNGVMSEEDQEALRLGRELQERRKNAEERKAARKKWAPWKRAVAAIVVIAILGGIGVQSQGGAEKVVEKIKGSHGFKEDDKISSSKDNVKNITSIEEEQAYEQIREQLGIDPVRILRTNDQIKYVDCDIDSDLRTAYMLYEYEGKTVSFIMDGTYTEDVWGIMFEEEKVEEYKYEGKKATINVEKYIVEDTKEEQWVGTFVYQGAYYCLTGHMKQDIFENLLKNLMFP